MTPTGKPPVREQRAGDADAPGPVLLTPRLIGDVNRSRILQAFCDHGPTTRADLARLAGVPRATIGAIAQGLVEDKILEEYEPDRTSRKVGKPGRPLWFRRDAGLCAAVSFAADGVTAAQVNARGEVLARETTLLATREASTEELLEAITAAVRSVVPKGSVLGIGLAVPGVCDTSTGTVVGSAQLPGATGEELVRGLTERFGVPTLVDNDARAQALAEKWFGDARGVQTFASVQTGEGLGVGLVLQGLVYRNDDGRTGELGHTVVDRSGADCHCGLTGCWETVATLRWLREQAAARGITATPRVDSESLVALGTPEASGLLDEYADMISLGLVTVVHVLGPRRILMHGDVVRGGEELRLRIEKHLRDRLLPGIRDDVEVVLSSINDDASLLGAAGLVLSETFKLAV